jgi:hypothetical protein
VAIYLYEYSFVTEVTMRQAPVVDIDGLSPGERARRFRIAAKVMRIFALKIPIRCEYYLLRAMEFDRLAEEEEKASM